MAFELRVPRSMSFGRLRPAGLRALRAAPSRLHVRPERQRTRPAPLPPEEVELAVRERLYGGRRSPR